ncbi:MAG TPA: hypothetical protein VM406_08510, partial [Noviherbaspirillum sp.]|nr:hypothetical protein [Noviherbaspirillum sp.]
MKKIYPILASLTLAFLSGCGGSSSDVDVSGGATPSTPAVASVNVQDDPEYIQFLEENSMLYQAARVADPISGSGEQWRREFGVPRPE